MAEVIEYGGQEKARFPTWFWYVAGGVAAVGVLIALKNRQTATSAPAEQQAAASSGVLPVSVGDIKDAIGKLDDMLKTLDTQLSGAFTKLEDDITTTLKNDFDQYVAQLQDSLTKGFGGLAATLNEQTLTLSKINSSLTTVPTASAVDYEIGLQFYGFMKTLTEQGRNTVLQWIEKNAPDCVTPTKVDFACIGAALRSGALDPQIAKLWQQYH